MNGIRCARVTGFLLLFICFTGRLSAQQFAIQGNASLISANTYRLTPSLTTQVGMVTNYYPLDLTTNFTLDFDLNLGNTDANGADGIAFMLSKSCSPVLTNGGGLGVEGNPNSIVVEFDTYDNGAVKNDIPSDHTGIYKDGLLASAGNIMDAATMPVCLLPGCANAEDGQWHNAKIQWEYLSPTQQRISVYFDGTLLTTSTGDHITNRFLGSNFAFWSVAGSTGALVNDQQMHYNGPSSDVTICTGNNFTLVAPAQGTNYIWTSNASTSNTATYTATVSGVINCDYIDFCNIPRRVSFNITAVQQPNVQQVTGNGPICPGTDAVFTITGNPGNVITYQVNGGSNQTVTIGAGGTATVTITTPATPQTITISQAVNGICIIPVSGLQATVTLLNLPAAPTVSGNGPICSGQDAVFTINSQAGNSIIYQVNGGPNQTINIGAGGTAQVILPAVSTDQVLTLISISNGSCTIPLVNNTATVQVLALPGRPLVTANDPVCEGDNAVFTFSGEPGSVITYQLNGGASQQLVLDAAGAGTITVSSITADQVLSVLQAANTSCVLPINDIQVTVHVLLKPAAPLVTGTATVCSGQDGSVTLSGTAGNTCTYQVNGGAAQQATIGAGGQATIVIPGITTNQQLVVTSVTMNGCTRVVNISFSITVLPLKFTTIARSICEGTSFEGYSVSGTYTDVFAAANGCDSTRVLQLRVDSPVKPNLGIDLPVCTGQTITISPGNFPSYIWQDGSTTPTFTVSTPGTYQVAVSTACGLYSDAITIYKGKCDVYFPSGFSPNGDGLNDQFRAITDLWLTEYELSVYNREGQLLFHSNNSLRGWDGTYKGQKQNSGIFVWTSTYKTSTGIVKSLKGTVMLIR